MTNTIIKQAAVKTSSHVGQIGGKYPACKMVELDSPAGCVIYAAPYVTMTRLARLLEKEAKE